MRLGAFKYKDFRLFWLGSLFSQMGDQMQIVAVSWQLYLLTHSAASLGLIGLCGLIPLLAFSLIGGVAADRVNRKKLMLVAQVMLSLIAFFLFFQTHSGNITPWMIYLSLIVVATINAFNLPTRQAVMPSLVPKEMYMNAISLNTLQFQSATIIGPAIAGFLIAVFGVGSIYLFNGLSFFILILAILKMTIPMIHSTKQASFSVASIFEGIKFVKDSPIISSTMMLDFLATFFGTANILMPVFAKDVLKVGAQGLGFLYAAPAVGGLIAGLFFSSKHKIKNQGKLMIGGVILYGLSTIMFGLSKSFYLSLFFLALTGVGDMISTIIRNTIRQLMTPDYIRGRMASVTMIFFQGGPKAGDMEAGFLASNIGGPFSVVLGGIGTVLITLLIAKKTPSLTNYRGNEVEI